MLAQQHGGMTQHGNQPPATERRAGLPPFPAANLSRRLPSPSLQFATHPPLCYNALASLILDTATLPRFARTTAEISLARAFRARSVPLRPLLAGLLLRTP